MQGKNISCKTHNDVTMKLVTTYFYLEKILKQYMNRAVHILFYKYPYLYSGFDLFEANFLAS